MLAQELDTTLIEAKIQSRLAKFLTLKEILVKLSLNPDANIRSKANVLLAVQEKLQVDMADALASIEKMKKEGYTTSGVASLGLFYYNVEKQIKEVDELAKSAGMTLEIQPAIPSWFVPAAAIGVLLVILWSRK